MLCIYYSVQQGYAFGRVAGLCNTTKCITLQHDQPCSHMYNQMHNPAHICAAGLCIWSCWLVGIYVYMWQKNWLFEVLLL